jgi:hypothetical protein
MAAPMRKMFMIFGVVLLSAADAALAQQDQQQPPPAAQPGAQAPPAERTSPWLFAPLVSSNPKLGTTFGGLGGYARKLDPDSRVSIFGFMAQYTSTESIIAVAFARTSFRADHHRIVGIAAFGKIKNDYEDYLGTGQPLRTNDDLKSVAGRYLYRATGNWFIGAQGNAANYQVFGESAEDELVLETLGVRGFQSAALGAVVMHDSRDNEDMPRAGWYLNGNNLAYRKALGGADSFDAFRADTKIFWPHGGRHVLAIRQFNWWTNDAPTGGEATVVLRGYKFGQYLAPYMSSLEAEERLLFGTRFGANLFTGLAGLYGERAAPNSTRSAYPLFGAGLQFVIKPDKRLLVSFEYAQGVEDNHGIYLKFGYAW